MSQVIFLGSHPCPLLLELKVEGGNRVKSGTPGENLRVHFFSLHDAAGNFMNENAPILILSLWPLFVYWSFSD